MTRLLFAKLDVGKRIRRDAVLLCLRQRQWRLALTVLAMPAGYELQAARPRKAGSVSFKADIETKWFHEYGFEGPEDFEAVEEFAENQGFKFVYGGATTDENWVGYPAAFDRLSVEHERLREGLRLIAEQQALTIAMIQHNGFVFDDIGREPGNWKHLAFSIYTDLCEVDTIVRALLDDEGTA